MSGGRKLGLFSLHILIRKQTQVIHPNNMSTFNAYFCWWRIEVERLTIANDNGLEISINEQVLFRTT